MQESFEIFFKTKSNKSNVIKVSRGPQFGKFGATFFFIISMFILLLAVMSILKNQLMNGFILIGVTIVLIGYLLDFRGFEIDFDNKRIRNYKSFLGLCYGEWFNLEEFNTLQIFNQNLLESRSLGSSGYGGKEYDTHHFYTIILFNRKKDKMIPIYEGNNYPSTMRFAEKLSLHSGLNLIKTVGKNKEEFC